ncbi:DUF2271 domain-containing protein [Bailinhaonella thermotolerans]|uniref:DUF2271 domain-containing protein n=1 Tax=Bailinhaonella thermotolerans TaxID=1070861 RepID=A0A3A4ABI3_9ACTN|nr:DUF2271 domain-containing protein [Bailinhaonella thermotolerans]RJL26626.1 DUF2271 domain-containing protein [Bailinhaonella thermotolerans]
MTDRNVRVVVPIVVISGVAAAATAAQLVYGQVSGPGVAAAPVASGPSAPPYGAAGGGRADTAGRPPGLVRIDYRLTRLPTHASNQIAIWIEDRAGRYVRTLFATSFTANGGYVRRPMSLPRWREAADWENATEAEIRAASRPAQESGEHSVYWDGTDRNGRPVPPGTYVYRIEGNVLWENRVLFTGEIRVGETAHESRARVEHLPAAARDQGVLLDGVRAAFLPGERLGPARVTAYTRGS